MKNLFNTISQGRKNAYSSYLACRWILSRGRNLLFLIKAKGHLASFIVICWKPCYCNTTSWGRKHGYSSYLTYRCIIWRERMLLVLVEAKDYQRSNFENLVNMIFPDRKHRYSSYLACRCIIWRGKMLLLCGSHWPSEVTRYSMLGSSKNLKMALFTLIQKCCCCWCWFCVLWEVLSSRVLAREFWVLAGKWPVYFESVRCIYGLWKVHTERSASI